MEIDETAYYPASHDVLKTIAARQKLGQWRNEQRNLPYYKISNRIFYKGSDILQFMESTRVEAQAA